ncbi:MAG: FtsX-like permease family protein [Desulfobacteraceae bacterium]|nr:FtsX-like permease family protein [Desulfobacteraceae bacterium]MBC2751738.1 ABC transporter permease [Desulfobacteraceae bacterium]
MTLNTIAIQNLLRRKGKAMLILVGLVLGIGTVITVISFSDAVTGDINHKLEKYGANILIVPRTENLSLSYGGIQMGGISFDMQELRETDLEAVKHIKNYRNIAAMGPMALGAVRVNDRPVMLAGVDFEEARILKPWWKMEGRQPEANAILAGAEAARVLNIAVGDTLEIAGNAVPVSGLLKPTGSQDDQLLFVTLPTAQALLGMPGQVSMVEVAALCTACPIEEMVQQISDALPGAKVMAIQQVVKGRMETLAQFKKLSFGVSVIIILIGSLVVLVTMTGSVRERKAEIGVFRAIGFRQRHVMRIILMEATLISIGAGVVGYLASMGATRLALMLFADNPHVVVPWNMALAAGALGMSLVVGVTASIYPALTAARMDPNDALRAL